MDNRFVKAFKDPRFSRPKKNQIRVKIDERFSALMTDPSFESVGSSASTRVDKYGRSSDVSTRKTVDMKRFYQLEEEEEEKTISQEEDVSESEIVEESGQVDDENVSRDEMARIARGEVLLESSDEEATERQRDSDEESLNDGIFRLGGDDSSVGSDAEVEEAKILDKVDVPETEPTRRFAVVNIDWDNFSATDLLKVFDGFKPKKGIVKSVSIYPSQFGKERMAEEEKQGPPAEIFKKPSKDGEQIEDEDAEDNDINEEIHEKDDDGEALDTAALRKYQLERLRYYFAVVECDSVSTAIAIFSECDGMEFESSSCVFDLRYIPDEMEFNEDEPKDVATQVSSKYQPKMFVTHVLQHSKPKLTWDEDDPIRTQVTRQKFTKDDLKNMDFNAYLASEAENSDEDPEELKKKYRSLLNGAGNDSGSDNEKDEVQGDMEITFTPGLAGAVSDILDKKKEVINKDETVFEKRLREKKERKKALKEARKNNQTQSENNDTSDDEPERSDIQHDPFFQDASGSEFEEDQKKPTKSKKTEKKRQKEEEEKANAELELLMMDETDKITKHFDYDEYSKKSKSKKKRKAGDDDDFQVDTSDPRFQALFESPVFAIDPTSSKFRKTPAMEKIVEERTKRKVAETTEQSIENSQNQTHAQTNDLSQLINKIKNKSKKLKQ